MEERKISPAEVLQQMLEKDQFTRWLGLQIDEHREGYCRLHYRVKDDMLNGFSALHGGVLFSASDSAFAFACNSHGRISVALDVTINFTLPAKSGDLLTVEAAELHLGNKTGVYEVRTTNQNNELVALFRGTAYRTEKQIGKPMPAG